MKYRQCFTIGQKDVCFVPFLQNTVCFTKSYIFKEKSEFIQCNHWGKEIGESKGNE